MNHGPWTACAAIALLGAGLAWRDAGSRPEPRRTPEPAAPQDAAPPKPASPGSGPLVVLTGNEKGFIRPCGCSKPKLGGIDRRAHAIGELRKKSPDLALVSTGELVDGGGRQQELKLDAFFMAMSAMNYTAFVPGAGDFRVGARALTEKRSLASFPFVLANAEVADAPPFEAQIKLGATGGVLVGLVEPMAPETGVKTSPAAEALRREAAKAGDPAFLLVVYNGPDEHLEALAASVPEALRAKTLFATPGHADAPLEAPKAAGGMPVVNAGAKGRALGLVRPGSKPLVESVVLEEKLPVDATAASILDGYRTAVREENLVTQLNRIAGPAKYVGDGRCKDCHAQTHDDLVDTKHQKAFATLVASKDERDPECVKCHVTGWGVNGGYVDADETPERRDVDCEQCHGPGSDHVMKLAKTPGGKVDAKTCVKCHDPDNSPQFKFETYWPKIVHR